ncbi:MAG: 50S ribosomal protein L34e [Candidatus Aenigmarchaeota archaeon ex4484_224]|nr:MAG: 50S ribosomal protein L34e [Candidatus Aenigmarchaeota archaeon ex4484_224]
MAKRKVKVRVATRTVTRIVRKTPKIARCAICGRPLHGIPRNVRKLSKSEKRVSRKYGGYLCSKCARELIKKEIYEKFG